MKILYYTTTNEVKHFPDGYSIDGILQPMGELQTGVWHLDYFVTAKPEHNEVTQYATSEFVPDYVNKKYQEVWTVHDRTAVQIAEYLNQQGQAAIQQVKDELNELFIEATYTDRLTEIASLPDGEAYGVGHHFPPWVPSGHVYATGNRFYYPADGKLYKVISAGHTSQPDHRPGEAHSLYSPIPEPGTAPEWSSFNSWEFQNMDIGTAVTDNGTIYYLTVPAQGHWQPSGAHGHHGWSTTNPL